MTSNNYVQIVHETKYSLEILQKNYQKNVMKEYKK